MARNGSLAVSHRAGRPEERGIILLPFFFFSSTLANFAGARVFRLSAVRARISQGKVSARSVLRAQPRNLQGFTQREWGWLARQFAIPFAQNGASIVHEFCCVYGILVNVLFIPATCCVDHRVIRMTSRANAARYLRNFGEGDFKTR